MSNSYYRRGGLMGPAILITIGSIFLIERWRPEYDFHHLWPVILIVIGVVKLLESGRRDSGPATPGAPGTGAATTPAAGVNQQSSSGGSGNA